METMEFESCSESSETGETSSEGDSPPEGARQDGGGVRKKAVRKRSANCIQMGTLDAYVERMAQTLQRLNSYSPFPEEAEENPRSRKSERSEGPLKVGLRIKVQGNEWQAIGKGGMDKLFAATRAYYAKKERETSADGVGRETSVDPGAIISWILVHDHCSESSNPGYHRFDDPYTKFCVTRMQKFLRERNFEIVYDAFNREAYRVFLAVPRRSLNS